jgi:hypothetical protein
MPSTASVLLHQILTCHGRNAKGSFPSPPKGSFPFALGVSDVEDTEATVFRLHRRCDNGSKSWSKMKLSNTKVGVLSSRFNHHRPSQKSATVIDLVDWTAELYGFDLDDERPLLGGIHVFNDDDDHANQKRR